MKRFVLALSLLFCLSGRAAELQFDLERLGSGELPKGFTPMLNGTGQPGEWKTLLDDVPSQLAPLTQQAKVVTKRPVIAQTGSDPTDERFPMLVYEDEVFGDFQAVFRFKTVSGKAEQMAGFVFRVQDANNFYVIRASALGNTFRFYKVINGSRTTPIGTEIQIPSGEWHEMKVASTGNKILAHLNGNQVLALSDDSDLLPPGKIGFWTKSDSVTYFADLRMTYTPRVPLAQTLIDDCMKRYPRIIGLRLYSSMQKDQNLEVIASNRKEDVGLKAIDGYQEILTGKAYAYGRTKSTVTVSLPLRDRNGDIAAVVRMEMERFPGQTENNAIARALPIIKLMEQKVRSKNDLIE